MSKGRSTTTLTVRNPQGEDEVQLEVAFDWWYDAGVRYHADGSGTPPDSGVEMTSFDTTDGKPAPDWLTEDMVQDALEKAELDAY
jgi:hypothetical protein